jgi:hypothetical protein
LISATWDSDTRRYRVEPSCIYLQVAIDVDPD